MQLDNTTQHLIDLDGLTIEHVVTGLTSAGDRFVDIHTPDAVYTIIMYKETSDE